MYIYEIKLKIKEYYIDLKSIKIEQPLSDSVSVSYPDLRAKDVFNNLTG